MRSLLIVLLLFGFLDASSRVVKIYTNLDNKPFAYYENGDIRGIYVDIVKYAVSRVGKYDVQFADTTTKKGIERLYENEILVYMSSIGKQSKENQDILYSMDNLNIAYKDIEYSLSFSQKPFMYKKDFTDSFNLALSIMKNSGQIDEIIDEYQNDKQKQVIPIALYNWGFMVSNELNGAGFIAELMQIIWNNAGYDVKFDIVTPHYANLLAKWAKALQMAPSLKEDEKLKFFYFSDPIMAMPLNLFYKKEDFPKGIKKDELSSYKIGAISRYYYDNALKENRLDIKYYESEDELFKALVGSNVDMIVAHKHLFRENIQKHDKNIDNYTMVDVDLLKDKFLYMVFAKNYYNSSLLKDKFNKSFKAIKQDGLLDKLIQKYNISQEFYNDTFGKVDGKFKKKEKNIFIFNEDY